MASRVDASAFAVFVALAALFPSACAWAQSQDSTKVRGVNPADIDTRFDVITKYNWLTGDAAVYTTTLKYDYRVTDKIGLNQGSGFHTGDTIMIDGSYSIF